MATIEIIDNLSLCDGDVIMIYMPEGVILVAEAQTALREWADSRDLKNCMFLVAHQGGARLEKLTTENYRTEAEQLRHQADMLDQRLADQRR